jgi:hypothetical protein
MLRFASVFIERPRCSTYQDIARWSPVPPSFRGAGLRRTRSNAALACARLEERGHAFWRNEPTLQKRNRCRAGRGRPGPFPAGALLFPVIYRGGLCCTRRRCSAPARSDGPKKPAGGVFSRAAPWTSLRTLEPFAKTSEDGGRHAGAGRSRPTPHRKGDMTPWPEPTST